MASHTGDHKPRKERTLREQGNIYADELADKALKAAEYDGIFIDSDFPFEQLRVKTGMSKVSGSLRKAIHQHWETSVA